MRRPSTVGLLALAALCLSTFALAPGASAGSPGVGAEHRNVPVCARPTAGEAGCHAIRHDRLDAAGKPAPTPVPDTATPAGYGPADIRSAYALTTDATATVAVVDAYDAPSAEADLGVYRLRYGLPACTAANGCFHKVNQNGGTTAPKANAGWAQEISLDLDMVSAACPGCHILLVEASSASFADLGTAVDSAAAAGAVAISNSYGGSDSAQSAHYVHPGVAVTASTGDAGYGVQSPASFPSVVAVGGTSLTRASGTARGWTETAWSGAGSGCSTINAKPTWQTAATTCSNKANADVAAVADPNTGVAVYDSYAYQGTKGWLVFGGTSAASPIVAGVYAMGPAAGDYPAAYTWGHAASLNDVTSGSNGSCAGSVLCTAGTGWDGPTGLGTPNGTGAF